MTWQLGLIIVGAVAVVCLAGYLGYMALRRGEGSDDS